MKSFYLITLLLICGSSLTAQIVDIPDANFKNALVNLDVAILISGGDRQDVDTNNDGEIQVAEAEAVVELFLLSQSIGTLEGIQSFSNLLFLDCANNQLTDLDLSLNPNLERLHCGQNLFTNLDLSPITNLRILECRGGIVNNLTLDNLDLITIRVFENNLIKSVISDGAPNLIYVDCHENQLTSLDLAILPYLETLTCQLNQLTSLDVSENPVLNYISCRDNDLINLNIGNGNNMNFSLMWAFGNPNLECIQVDDENYSNSQDCPNDDWCIDPTASYNEDCVLGFNDIAKANQITVYPNPVENKLYTNNTRNSIKNIRLFSSEGKLISISVPMKIDIDVSHLEFWIVLY